MSILSQLAISPETIGHIANMAREFHAKEQVSIPEESLSYTSDWAMQILADHKDDPIYEELNSVIDDLEPDQQVQLVAIMWLGRNDFSADEWNKALEQAADSWNEKVAAYLISKPLLATYLEEGLSQLGYSLEDYSI